MQHLHSGPPLHRSSALALYTSMPPRAPGLCASVFVASFFSYRVFDPCANKLPASLEM